MNPVFLIILIVIGYTIIFYQFRLSESKIWMDYGQSMYNLSIFAALIIFILDQREKESRDKSDRISQINQSQERGFAEIEKLFSQYYPESLPLYKEMNSHSKTIQSLPIPNNIDQSKRRLVESNIVNIVLQTVENNYLTALSSGSGYINSYEFSEWLSTWRQWFKSPTLRQIWSDNKGVLFSPKTANFIDNIIIGQHPFNSINHNVDTNVTN